MEQMIAVIGGMDCGFKSGVCVLEKVAGPALFCYRINSYRASLSGCEAGIAVSKARDTLGSRAGPLRSDCRA